MKAHRLNHPKGVLALIAACALFSCMLCGAYSANTAYAAEPSVAEGSYVLVPQTGATRAVDVEGYSADNGAGVQLWDSNGNLNQRVDVLLDEQTGTYTLRFEHSGKVLDVSAGLAEAGTRVDQWEANGTLAQQWEIVPTGDGSYWVQSALGDGLTLDVCDGIDADGASLQVWSLNGASAQKFYFIEAPATVTSDIVEDGVYTLTGVGSGKNLDVTDAATNDGAHLQIWSGNGNTAQMYRVVLTPSGYYRIINVNSGKSLDADGGAYALGLRVNQWSEWDSYNQVWAIHVNSDGSWTLINAANGLALEVAGNSSDNGAEVRTWQANGTTAQSWVATPVAHFIADGYYRMDSLVSDSRVLDVAGGSATDGANAEIYTSNGSAAQTWLITNQADGCVTIESLCSGALLTQTGSNVDLCRANGSSAQHWAVEASPTGGLRFINEASGSALDVQGAGDWDCNNVGAAAVNDTAAQAWRPTSTTCIGDGTYEIVCMADGRALDITNRSRANGANLQLWSRNGDAAQKFVITNVGGGYWTICNARSKKALDVDSGGQADGTNVQQWENYGGASQLWTIEYVGGGAYRFVSAVNGKALDASGAGGWDGANVDVWSINNTAAQAFYLYPTTYVPENFVDLIGQFTTYSQNTANGTWNMQLALGMFNGYIIWPGQTMSFFGVTGRCDSSQGFLEAGVVGGTGIGGGICQASTTIYGAAIRSGLTIVTRNNHSVPSVYVPIGLDAMVNWGTSDLVIRNDYDFPVKIVTSTPDRTLTCSIYGIQPEWFDYCEPSSWYTSSYSAAANRTYYKDGVAVLTQSLPSSFYYG